MDPRDQDRIFGAITAQNQLLEHLWAFVLAEIDDPATKLGVIAAVRDKMLREHDLPGGDAPSEERFAAGQHAVSIVEEFWDRMARRVGPE